MAVPTDPNELAEAARCYCYGDNSTSRVIVYLLANIAGLQAQTPAALAQAAACYCYDEATMKRVMAYLLCQAANGGGGPSVCGNLEGAGDPT